MQESLPSQNMPYQHGHTQKTYMLYAYQSYDPARFGYNKWECLTHYQTREEALQRGDAIFNTNLYQKIEIKEKMYDPRRRRHVLTTYHSWKRDLLSSDNKAYKWKKAIYWVMAFTVLFSGLFVIL